MKFTSDLLYRSAAHWRKAIGKASARDSGAPYVCKYTRNSEFSISFGPSPSFADVFFREFSMWVLPTSQEWTL